MTQYQQALRDFCDRGEAGLAVQNSGEFDAFVQALKRHRVSNLVEIGTRQGGGAVLFALAGLNVCTLDLADCRDAVQRLAGEYGVTDRVRALCISSAEPDAIDAVRAIWPEGPDCVFVDGDHRMKNVARDHELWRAQLRPGAIMAFHDVAHHDPICQVPHFWRQLKPQTPGVACHDICVDSGYGIGWFIPQGGPTC